MVGIKWIFNFEGGCYAKTSKLTNQSEPMIFNAIKEKALLENVKLLDDNQVDFEDTSLTENGRVSYPISHIEKRIKNKSAADHPSNIIFLSADATGVLPPISCLSYEQAIYYYLSGYTSKAIGTETRPNRNTINVFFMLWISLSHTTSRKIC